MNPVLKLMQAKGLSKKAAEKLLPKAERDENLKKFLEPSAVQMRLYHGTTATHDIHGKEAIRQLKPSKEGALGSGVYLTPKTQFASEYADPYIPGSTDFASGNVLPVYAQLRNPLVLEGKGDPMIEALTKLGIDESKAARMVERAYENKGYIGKEVESRARAQGFDGLMQYRDGELSEVVSYNPSAIKSALGNEGTYDTSVPLLNKADGGLIRMQDGGGEIKASPQNKYIGAVADALKAAQGFAGKYQVDPRIPLLGGMGVDELLGLPGAESLVRDVSYYGPKAAIKGGNVATGGLGTFTLDPRVLDVAGVAETGALAAQAAKGAGRAIGRQLQQQITQTPLQSQMGAVNITAPVSKLGFYNPIEEMATTLQRKQGPGQAFLNEFTKAGISKQRLEDAGLTQKLATTPNITREEVQALTKGSMPDVEEVVLSRSVIPPFMKEFAGIHMPDLNVNDSRQVYELRRIANERYKAALEANDLDAAELAMRAEEDINKFKRTHSYGTKPGERLTEYHEYQEPGGKNYREVLLKAPVKRISEEEARRVLNAKPDAMLTDYDIEYASRLSSPEFRSSHWSDPNVISHIRMNDRVDADNKNVLFIEELQSDWAREGRKKGFGKDVPSGPFIKNTNEWVDLSLKNIIKRAVDEGYDRVAFIDGYKSFLRFPQGADGKSTEAGMRKFYDEVVPSRLKTLVGKDNVRTIPGITQQPQLDVSLHGNRYFVVDADTDIPLPNQDGFRSVERAEQYLDEVLGKTQSMDQIGFDITPEIREKFSQPIPYKHGGVVKMAAGGADKLLKRGIDRVVKHKDPPTTKIQEWQWRPLAEVNQQLKLAEVPDYIQRGYGDFMIEQAKRAASGNLGVRDLIKAYGITQSSIGRGGLSYETATKAGLKVPKVEGLVRPEGAFAEWLGSKQGQKFLDDAERGVVNEKALDDIRTKFAPFGKANQLTEQLRYGVNNMSTLVPQMQKALVGPADEYRDWAESMKGIAGAKSGFIGSMLGRGDLPTLDARQLNLHALEAPVAPQTMMQRGKGLGAREAVDRLAARQSVLGLDIDPSLDPYYQHLAHHAVWDKVADEKTTHDDLMRALRGYKQGGTPDTDAMRLEMMRKSWRSK